MASCSSKLRLSHHRPVHYMAVNFYLYYLDIKLFRNKNLRWIKVTALQLFKMSVIIQKNSYMRTDQLALTDLTPQNHYFHLGKTQIDNYLLVEKV